MKSIALLALSAAIRLSWEPCTNSTVQILSSESPAGHWTTATNVPASDGSVVIDAADSQRYFTAPVALRVQWVER